MRPKVALALGLLITTSIIALPIWYAMAREQSQRNFRIVDDGKLYRSGQLSQPGLQRAIAEYGIRTIISLRYSEREGKLPPDAAEEAWCAANGIRFIRIRPREWSSPSGEIPAEQAVRQFLDVMDDPQNHPVLIHCFAGVHRTGAYCGIYRMEYQGWSGAAALREMRHIGYDNLDKEWDVRTYISEYQRRTSTSSARPE